MSVRRPEIDILVEGYDDRAFLKGLLPKLGWTDLAPDSSKANQARAFYKQEQSKVLATGVFAFSRGEGDERRFALVHAVDGDGQLEGKLKALLDDRARPVVVIADSDDMATDHVATPKTFLPRSESRGDGAVVHRVFWTLPLPATEGVPDQQALERIVVAALCRAFPERKMEVARWLQSRSQPAAGDKLHKAYAWSHLAGWFNNSGFQHFYEECWKRPVTAQALRELMSLPLRPEQEAPTLWTALERALS